MDVHLRSGAIRSAPQKLGGPEENAQSTDKKVVLCGVEFITADSPIASWLKGGRLGVQEDQPLTTGEVLLEGTNPSTNTCCPGCTRFGGLVIIHESKLGLRMKSIHSL